MSCFSTDLYGIVRVFGLLAVVWVVEVRPFGEMERGWVLGAVVS